MEKKDILLRELYIIRHGETFTNLEDYKPADKTEKNDPLLTETGKNQAALLGQYYKRKGITFDAFFTSGLRRTVMTGEEIVKYLDLPIRVLPDLCEYGIEYDYKGATLDELKNLSPRVCLADDVIDNGCLIIPDETPGENESRYFDRAGRVFDYLAEHFNNGERIAVVSHAGFITYMIFYLLGYRDAEPLSFDFGISNTGVTKIRFFEPGTYKYGEYSIDAVNDKSHLA